MPGVQRVVIVDPSNDSRQVLQNVLVSLEGVMLDAVCPRYDVFLDIVQQYGADVAIVALDSDPDAAVAMVQNAAAHCPDVDIIAVSSRTDGRFILDLIRKGAKEFVGLPLQLEELLGALTRLRDARAPSDQKGQEGSRIYAFAGARGGVGCTSIAVNFGCELARQKSSSVVLVDLNLAMGDADVCLDIVPDYTLADVVLNIDRIDLQLLKRSLSKHPSSGLYLLPHPVKIEDASLIREDHISRVISMLKLNFTHVILDLSKAFGAIDFMAMTLSDEILLTIQLDVSSLHNVLRLIQSLGERDDLVERVKVIANRVGADGSEITIQRAEETISRPIICQIPNDARTMMASRNSGVPLYEHAPKSKLYQSIVGLAETLLANGRSAEAPTETKKGGFGWFGR